MLLLSFAVTGCGSSPPTQPVADPPVETSPPTAPLGRPPSAAVPPESEDCRSDDDCTLDFTGGCCSCPPEEPVAMTAEREKAMLELCAVVDCEVVEPCPAVNVDPAAWSARCRDGFCRAVRR